MTELHDTPYLAGDFIESRLTGADATLVWRAVHHETQLWASLGVKFAEACRRANDEVIKSPELLAEKERLLALVRARESNKWRTRNG